MPEFCNYPKCVIINCEHFFKWLHGQSLKKNINSHCKDTFYVFIIGYILIPKACPYFLECSIQGIKSWDSSPPSRAKSLPQMTFCNKDYTFYLFIPWEYPKELYDEDYHLHLQRAKLRLRNPWLPAPNHFYKQGVLQSMFSFLASPMLFPSVCATHNNPWHSKKGTHAGSSLYHFQVH